MYNTPSEKDPGIYRSSHDSDASDSLDDLQKDPREVEAQQQNPQPVEHQIPLRSKLVFLGAYFILNLALTLSNKAVLGKV